MYMYSYGAVVCSLTRIPTQNWRVQKKIIINKIPKSIKQRLPELGTIPIDHIRATKTMVTERGPENAPKTRIWVIFEKKIQRRSQKAKDKRTHIKISFLNPSVRSFFFLGETS